MNDPTPPPHPDQDPTEPPSRALDPALAVEATFALAFSALLCWNAWPWIAAQAESSAQQPAIAAATMGAQRYAFARLEKPTRLVIATTLLILVLIALLRRLAATTT